MNTWYDSLVNYIPEPVRKIVGGFEDKVVDLYNTNTLKQTVYETGKKLSKPKTLKQSDLKKIFSYKKKKKKKKLKILEHFLKRIVINRKE